MKRIIKNYKKWMGVKSKVNNHNRIINFNEGDVVWAAVGENVGVEIDGKGEKYSRPVVVLKKHTNRCFTGVPLTSKPHKGSWYFKFVFQEKDQFAVLIQKKLIDAARIYKRMGKLSKKDYNDVLSAYMNFIKNKNMP